MKKKPFVKPQYIPDNIEERKKIETIIAQRVIKNSDIIDAQKAGNQLISAQQSKKKQKRG